MRRRFEGSEPSAEDLSHVATVFYMTDDRSNLRPTPSDDQWQRTLSNIEAHLRHFAQAFLQQAPLYNAAKHGLAFRPTEASMIFNEGLI